MPAPCSDGQTDSWTTFDCGLLVETAAVVAAALVVVAVRVVVARVVGGGATVVFVVVIGALTVVAALVGGVVVAVVREAVVAGAARWADEPQPAAASNAKQTERVTPVRATGGQGTRVAACPPFATSWPTSSPTSP